MSFTAGRCHNCKHSWSRYLRFTECPKCGADIAAGILDRELARVRWLWRVLLVIFAAAWLLALIGIILKG